MPAASGLWPPRSTAVNQTANARNHRACRYIMTISRVALSADWSQVRRLRRLIVTGAIPFLSSILILDPQVDAQTSATATGNRKDSSNATAVVAPGVKDKVDVRTISKTIFNEASRLKNDAAGWDQKLQELELDLDLKKRQQDFEAMAKDLDECLVVLRAAADRLAPDAEARRHSANRRVPFER